MGVNKVEFGGETLIDLTNDSVTPETLAEGVTAHDASGEQIVGTMSLNKIKDLLGTTWHIKSGWLCTAQYGSFGVDCEVVVKVTTTDTRTFSSDNFKLGYTLTAQTAVVGGGGSFAEYYPCENNIVLKLTTGGHAELYNGYDLTITFNGGTGTTDSKLIDWVTTYGEMVVESTPAEAIIDVTELPTENINTKNFYRVLTAKWVFHKEVYNSFTCYCVETLPESAEVATTDMVTITTYYNAQDGIVYGYVDDMLGGYFGIPAGWYEAEMLFGAAGLYYGGVITDIEDDLEDGSFRVLLESVIYTNTDGKWVALKGVGSAGTGINAEIFNDKNNQASGDYSHAEGDFTNAKGHSSHTEGECTVATARNQHAQGRYNIEDTEEQYAHIVGNGEDGARSNAHTIDWQGNAWFAGKIKVGGIGQDDPNAKELITDTSKFISKYVVEITGSERVSDIIKKLQDTYPDYQLGVWSIISLTGATSGLYGISINHYGGNIYNISGMDFGTCYSMSNRVTDWSTVSVWAFSGYFQPPIPYCDDSNNGQVLKVVNGVPTWVDP